jgi:putative hydrolase of the HAD superfamily
VVIAGVVFDLDDTLYPERQYVRSGFAHVAAIAGRTESESQALAAWLEEAFEAGIRGDTFDRLALAFPEVVRRHSVPALVDAYRTHEPAIELAPGVESVLQELQAQGLRLGVLSDGPLASQAAKARRLRLDRWFDPVLLTASLGQDAAKPSPKGFEAIARGWGIDHAGLAYVADNPQKDFVAPRRLGWLTVRLRYGGQLRFAIEPPDREFRAELEVASLDDLPTSLGLSTPG